MRWPHDDATRVNFRRDGECRFLFLSDCVCEGDVERERDGVCRVDCC